MTHYHYLIIGYDETDGPNVKKPIDINIIGLTVEGAIKKAKSMYSKKYWYVRSITECFGVHGDEMLDNLSKMFEKFNSKDKEKFL